MESPTPPDPQTPQKRGRGRPRKAEQALKATTTQDTAPKAPSGLPPDLLALLSDPKLAAALKREVQGQLSTMRLQTFTAYPKQKEFFEAGATNKVRCLLAANRFGKSHCAAFETACHLTGLYPSWWTGRRFKEPVTIWAASENTEMTRNVMQEKLIGPPSRPAEWGTGLIPKSCIGDSTALRGVASAIDTISIKHVSGGWSTLQFKSYQQGAAKFQGVALHACWLDEEAPFDIYEECLTRLATTRGILYLTFTPII